MDKATTLRSRDHRPRVHVSTKQVVVDDSVCAPFYSSSPSNSAINLGLSSDAVATPAPTFTDNLLRSPGPKTSNEPIVSEPPVSEPPAPHLDVIDLDGTPPPSPSPTRAPAREQPEVTEIIELDGDEYDGDGDIIFVDVRPAFKGALQQHSFPRADTRLQSFRSQPLQTVNAQSGTDHCTPGDVATEKTGPPQTEQHQPSSTPSLDKRNLNCPMSPVNSPAHAESGPLDNRTEQYPPLAFEISQQPETSSVPIPHTLTPRSENDNVAQQYAQVHCVPQSPKSPCFPPAFDRPRNLEEQHMQSVPTAMTQTVHPHTPPRTGNHAVVHQYGQAHPQIPGSPRSPSYSPTYAQQMESVRQPGQPGAIAMTNADIPQSPRYSDVQPVHCHAQVPQSPRSPSPPPAFHYGWRRQQQQAHAYSNPMAHVNNSHVPPCNDGQGDSQYQARIQHWNGSGPTEPQSPSYSTQQIPQVFNSSGGSGHLEHADFEMPRNEQAQHTTSYNVHSHAHGSLVPPLTPVLSHLQNVEEQNRALPQSPQSPCYSSPRPTFRAMVSQQQEHYPPNIQAPCDSPTLPGYGAGIQPAPKPCASGQVAYQVTVPPSPTLEGVQPYALPPLVPFVLPPQYEGSLSPDSPNLNPSHGGEHPPGSAAMHVEAHRAPGRLVHGLGEQQQVERRVNPRDGVVAADKAAGDGEPDPDCNSRKDPVAINRRVKYHSPSTSTFGMRTPTVFPNSPFDVMEYPGNAGCNNASRSDDHNLLTTNNNNNSTNNNTHETNFQQLTNNTNGQNGRMVETTHANIADGGVGTEVHGGAASRLPAQPESEVRNVRSELWTICQDTYDVLSKGEGGQVFHRTTQLFDDPRAVVVLRQAAQVMRVSKFEEVDKRVYEFGLAHGELMGCSLTLLRRVVIRAIEEEYEGVVRQPLDETIEVPDVEDKRPGYKYDERNYARYRRQVLDGDADLIRTACPSVPTLNPSTGLTAEQQKARNPYRKPHRPMTEGAARAAMVINAKAIETAAARALEQSSESDFGDAAPGPLSTGSAVPIADNEPIDVDAIDDGSPLPLMAHRHRKRRFGFGEQYVSSESDMAGGMPPKRHRRSDHGSRVERRGVGVNREYDCPDSEMAPGQSSGIKGSKGESLLRKMGWQRGQGLGAAKDGLKNPLRARMRPKRIGLGGQ